MSQRGLGRSNLNHPESKWGGVLGAHRLFFFFKTPEKGFLTSPDLAGDGEGSRRAPPPTLGAMTLTSLCSSLAPDTPPGEPVFNLSFIRTQNCETSTPNCDSRPWPRHTETPDPRL